MPRLKTVLIVASLTALAACDSSKSEINQTAHDVQYFLDHPHDRKVTLDECHNNPRELGDIANCKNAFAAERDAFINEAQDALNSSN